MSGGGSYLSILLSSSFSNVSAFKPPVYIIIIVPLIQRCPRPAPPPNPKKSNIPTCGPFLHSHTKDVFDNLTILTRFN